MAITYTPDTGRNACSQTGEGGREREGKGEYEYRVKRLHLLRALSTMNFNAVRLFVFVYARDRFNNI
jgi:hypothetical protein